MTPDILLWGGTGQARVLADLIGSTYRIAAIVDRNIEASPLCSAELLRGERDVDQWLADRPTNSVLFGAVAIGGGHGAERRRLAKFLTDRGIELPSLVHSRAIVTSACTIGDGAQILAGSIIATGVRIGSSVIVNTGAQVDHDSLVGDGAHIGPGAMTAGEVTIGEDAFVGTGAVILPRISVGRGATVGAGAVVVTDVPPNATVVGCPARILSVENNKRG